MSKILTLVALAAIMLSTFAALAATRPAGVTLQPASSVQCEVRVTNVGTGIELKAVALANRSIKGDYHFDLDGSGPGGSSTVSQGGEFVLRPSQEQVLGSAWVNGGPRASFTARLKLNGVRGDRLCNAEAEATGSI